MENVGGDQERAEGKPLGVLQSNVAKSQRGGGAPGLRSLLKDIHSQAPPINL